MTKLKELYEFLAAEGWKGEVACSEIAKAQKAGTRNLEAEKNLASANEIMEDAIQKIFAELDKPAPRHFSRENTWIWGGPTPRWGGSMEPDCAVKGAEYFDLENIAYMYGPVDEEAIQLHSGAKKLLCQLSEIARSPGANRGTDAETAERLSQLSLKYPNIKGGIIDDAVGNFGKKLTLEGLQEISSCLKKYNQDLKLYTVIYAGEMDSPHLKTVEPYVDAVNFWVGLKYQLPTIDLAIEKCRAAFPGKEIMLGIFIYDYFAADHVNSKNFLRLELERARKYLSEGKIHDLIILGDREIAKCPEESAFVKEFLLKEFSSNE